MKFEQAVAEFEGALGAYDIKEIDARTYLGLGMGIANITEMCRRVGLYRSQFYRSCEELLEMGFVTHDEKSGIYSQVHLTDVLKRLRSEDEARKREIDQMISHLKEKFGEVKPEILGSEPGMYAELKDGLTELFKPHFAHGCKKVTPGLAARLYLELIPEKFKMCKTAERIDADRMRVYRLFRELEKIGFVFYGRRDYLRVPSEYRPVHLQHALEAFQLVEDLGLARRMDRISHLEKVLGKEKVEF